MPYKLRDDRRHKFKKARYKINNWSEYNQALKNRGSIFLWLSDDVIKSWYENKINHRERGAPNKYSNIAIKTALTIKSVYSLPYRATEGLLVSIFNAMKLNLDVPDYTRMCRRAKTLEIVDLKNINPDEHINVIVDSTVLKIFGQGEWHQEKHGLKKRKKWRKLHLVIDRETQAIIAQELTDDLESDPSQVKSLLGQVEEKIISISADGAYDTDKVYREIEDKSEKSVVVAIPPRQDAALSLNYQTEPTARDHNILFAEKYGKYRWQDYSDYNYRALVETAMFRYKKIIGNTMYSRNLSSQKVESKITCEILNKMASLGMPKSTKIKEVA